MPPSCWSRMPTVTGSHSCTSSGAGSAGGATRRSACCSAPGTRRGCAPWPPTATGSVWPRSTSSSAAAASWWGRASTARRSSGWPSSRATPSCSSGPRPRRGGSSRPTAIWRRPSTRCCATRSSPPTVPRPRRRSGRERRGRAQANGHAAGRRAAPRPAARACAGEWPRSRPAGRPAPSGPGARRRLPVGAGRLGGRRLAAPPGRLTRPTPERVREALFSTLGPIGGARVLDLFAGSGALGIEAISRGAAELTLVDSSPPAIQAIRRNLSALGVEAEVRRQTAAAFLHDARRARRQYDLVFLDPPYAQAAGAGPELAPALVPVLATGARVVAESDRRAPLELAPLARIHERRYGDTLIQIYTRP